MYLLTHQWLIRLISEKMLQSKCCYTVLVLVINGFNVYVKILCFLEPVSVVILLIYFNFSVCLILASCLDDVATLLRRQFLLCSFLIAKHKKVLLLVLLLLLITK